MANTKNEGSQETVEAPVPVKELTADPKEVKKLRNYLVRKFEKYISEKKKGHLSYVDAMMGVHNFYKAIILDLEERTGNTGLLVNMARATLEYYTAKSLEKNENKENEKTNEETKNS